MANQSSNKTNNSQQRTTNGRSGARNKKYKREQPRKDSSSKRVNFDNERLDRYERDSKRSDCNDISYYNRNPEMLRSACSITMNNTTGIRVGWGSTDTVPGVMELKWVPNLGGADAVPLNAAANSVYSYVVHANSRTSRYDAPDLMILMIAGASAFSMIAYGIRAYGVMMNYDQTNAYTPQALIKAMGFNFQDLKSNLSTMWFDLNELVSRSSQIWIPNTMPFIERWFKLNSNIYMDADNEKAQYYLFRPTAYLVYDEMSSEKGGFLSYESTSLINGDLKWADYMSIVNQQMDALLNSQDRGYIFGDVLKAYGADKIYAISPIPVDYRVIPAHNVEVQTQIENLNVYNGVPFALSQDPDNNTLYTNWGSVANGTKIGIGKLVPPQIMLNFHFKENPTPEQVMIATRLTIAGTTAIYGDSANPTAVTNLVPTYCGSEYVYSVSIHYYSYATGVPQLAEYIIPVLTGDGGGLVRRPLMLYTAFDWAPQLYYITNTTGVTEFGNQLDPISPPTLDCTVTDFDNFTIVDDVTIGKMHLAALYSELNVPTM